MKKITVNILFAMGVAALLSSCGSINRDNFARARYYNFGHNDPVITFNKPSGKEQKKVTPQPEKPQVVAEAVNAPSAVVTNAKPQQIVTVNRKAVAKQINHAVKSVATPANSEMRSKPAGNYSITNSIADNIQKQTDTKGGSSVDPVLLIILAILISPLAVYLHDNAADSPFVIDLILWILGIGIGLEVPFAFLLWLAAVIYAIVIVTGS